MNKEKFIQVMLKNEHDKKEGFLKALGCNPEYVVYSTKNYGLFKESFDNRIDFKNEPNTPTYKKLKESIMVSGRNLEPITVREVKDQDVKFEVIKGHHRYWACKMTNSELYFRIDNQSTLDESIVETRGTRNWNEHDLYRRGLIHKVPICMMIDDMFGRFPILSEYNGVGLRLILDNLSTLGYPSRRSFFKMLESINGIQKLKSITVHEDDIKELRMRLFRVLEIMSISNDYFTEKDVENGYNKHNFIMQYVEVFTKRYNMISKNYDEYIKEWEKNCKVKSNKTARVCDKELYLDMTSRDKKHIDKAIIELCGRVI